MRLQMKKRLGLLFPILSLFLLLLLILSASRLALSLWQFSRVNSVHGWLPILFGGLRIDISTLCYLLGVPALLSCFMPVKGRAGQISKFILCLFIVFAFWLLIFMEVVTPPFILEYDLRPNRLFVEYLVYPKEVFGMLWAGYKLELLIAFVSSVVTIILSWKLSRYLVKDIRAQRWFYRPFLAVVVVALTILGGRGTLGHRPINPAFVDFSVIPLANDLALNSAYSVAFAIKQMASEVDASKYYPPMKKQKIIDLVRKSTRFSADKFTSKTVPTLVNRTATYKGKPKNLVILLQESLGARYVGALGGLPLTPNIDKLIKSSWSFNRAYATGTRSVRGIEAVIAGFPPTPSRSVVKLDKSRRNFFTIASLLKAHGYHTQFIYAGESHFDNMKTFFLGNGFVDMEDAPTFKHPKFVGSWGACDEDLYDKADAQFSMLHKKGKPFFSLVFSTSNHTPFAYPAGKIKHYNEPAATRENAAKYSDYAIGTFLKKAEKSSYWKDTVFVIVADHDSRAYGNQLVPIDHFRIPVVIFGGGIKKKTDNRLISQLDLPPTLLSLIGISSRSPMIGHDMTKHIAKDKLRALMQFNKYFAWMDNNYNVVIFQPQKPASTYVYDPKTEDLTKKAQPKSFIKMGNANALWGSLAYKEGLYPFKEKKK